MSKAQRAPARSSEEQERRCIALSMNLAERQLSEGSASPNVICHFLKLATEKEKAETEKLRYQSELLKSQKESIDRNAANEELFKQALDAFRGYQGTQDENLQ